MNAISDVPAPMWLKLQFSNVRYPVVPPVPVITTPQEAEQFLTVVLLAVLPKAADTLEMLTFSTVILSPLLQWIAAES
ncbi:hypothetical protein ABN329_00005 [Escherichia coli]